jgi:ABC-type uncharacterized transport system substrate-binding protein
MYARQDRVLGARMFRQIAFLIVMLLCLVGSTPYARAHPHVWVTMTSELLYAPDGSVTGVRHAWTFDDMFSPRSMSSRCRNMGTSPT